MIRFTVTTTLRLTPGEICDRIFDVSNWESFTGCGPIPGIRKATTDGLTEARVGTRFNVTNTDGSAHRETVTEYVEGKTLTLRMDGFTPPLSRIASHFEERWAFAADGDRTRVSRSFELRPKSWIGHIPLRLAAFFLKRAVRAHLKDMDDPNGKPSIR